MGVQYMKGDNAIWFYVARVRYTALCIVLIVITQKTFTPSPERKKNVKKIGLAYSQFSQLSYLLSKKTINKYEYYNLVNTSYKLYCPTSL